jgi:NAD(P)-dependent dehydrogenase (short-subunit alcohol dehydrogenase family)
MTTSTLTDTLTGWQRRSLGIDGFSPTELAPAVALVTGGGRGIGRMLTRALAGTGASVGVVARSSTELDETVALVEAAGGTATTRRRRRHRRGCPDRRVRPAPP